GFRPPLAEPGVRLSIRTGLSIDVDARARGLAPQCSWATRSRETTRALDNRGRPGLIAPARLGASFAPGRRRRLRAPHTWLPGDSAPIQSTASLRPCARLSRAPTTTKAPPLGRDVAGLGGLPGVSFPAHGSRFSCSWREPSVL